VRRTVLVGVEVNGVYHEVLVEPRRTLADLLREDLGYTGTHLGCEQGICGACTVLLDGRAVRSCLVFGVQVDGHIVRTVEDLSGDGELSDLQDAFSRHHALQCGFCTPGFLMLAEDFLASVVGRCAAGGTPPDAGEVREAMSANLCRCTGYQGIVEAVVEVAARRSAAR